MNEKKEKYSLIAAAVMVAVLLLVILALGALSIFDAVSSFSK